MARRKRAVAGDGDRRAAARHGEEAEEAEREVRGGGVSPRDAGDGMTMRGGRRSSGGGRRRCSGDGRAREEADEGSRGLGNQMRVVREKEELRRGEKHRPEWTMATRLTGRRGETSPATIWPGGVVAEERHGTAKPKEAMAPHGVVHGEGGDSVVDWGRGAADGVRCGATALWEAVARPGEASLAGGERLEAVEVRRLGCDGGMVVSVVEGENGVDAEVELGGAMPAVAASQHRRQEAEGGYTVGRWFRWRLEETEWRPVGGIIQRSRWRRWRGAVEAREAVVYGWSTPAGSGARACVGRAGEGAGSLGNWGPGRWRSWPRRAELAAGVGRQHGESGFGICGEEWGEWRRDGCEVEGRGGVLDCTGEGARGPEQTAMWVGRRQPWRLLEELEVGDEPDRWAPPVGGSGEGGGGRQCKLEGDGPTA
uniref:Uncharacterized protein n=1 Tax=Oryza sativa subsp. japonica TaxID=39947 RepID=Q5ZA80_ORYSJ|nr:hypothetical protein [Oryza sativa Japonica Group]